MLAPKWYWRAGWALLGIFVVFAALGQAGTGLARWMLILIPVGTGHWVIPWPIILGMVCLWTAAALRARERRRGLA